MDFLVERQKLHKTCETFFYKEIYVSDRATSAFINTCQIYQIFDAHISISSDLNVFCGVIENSPACAKILSRKHIDLESLYEKPSTLSKNSKKKMIATNYKAILDDIFIQNFPFSHGLTVTGKKVQNSGLLTEVDIFVGTLEAARNRLFPNLTGEKILRAAGLYDGKYPDSSADDFLLGIELICSSIIDLDYSHSSQQFVVFLDDDGKLRLRPFGANVFGTLDELYLPKGPFVFRGDVIQPITSSLIFSEKVIGQLEEMMNSQVCSEQDFQKYFELHPQLLTGLNFSKAHPQPILFKDDGSKLIPDFFLEKIDSGWDAILDLKKPYDSMVIRRNNRVYFKQWVQEAIAQLQYYREWFDSSNNRGQFEETLKIKSKVFRPKMIIVAGRSYHFLDDVERMRLLSNQQSEIDIWTYDDLLKKGKRYKSLLS